MADVEVLSFWLMVFGMLFISFSNFRIFTLCIFYLKCKIATIIKQYRLFHEIAHKTETRLISEDGYNLF
jgi:hypothetical protein